jgi:hypothetical protein
LKKFFENHRGSGAARFFYKPSRRGSGAVAFFYKPSRRGSFFSNVAAQQRQFFSRDGHLCQAPAIFPVLPGHHTCSFLKAT